MGVHIHPQPALREIVWPQVPTLSPALGWMPGLCLLRALLLSLGTPRGQGPFPLGPCRL